MRIDPQLLKQAEATHVIEGLREKLEIDNLANHFTLPRYKYNGKNLNVDSTNGMMFEFRTLPGESSGAPVYKLLLMLGLKEEDIISDVVKAEIQRIKGRDNIDKIVVWSINDQSSAAKQALKSVGVDILYIQLEEFEKLRYISNFFPHAGRDYDYEVAVNAVADILMKRLKKLFHLILSEVAAPIYNQLYAKAKFATASTMSYEEKIINDLSKTLKKNGRNEKVVDVGCGTGRHSFLLATDFKEVYGFDFSPKMINVANDTKRVSAKHNAVFSVDDFEYEETMYENDFQGKTDLVVASFGMGSFVEDTARMLRRFSQWLKEGGYVFLSFYNSKSILLNVQPNWRDTSLSAHLDVDKQTLQVRLPTGAIFDIYCKPFTETTRHEISKVFEIEAVYTYPTLMALMPNSMLDNPLAADLFQDVDTSLATDNKYQLGHYVMVLAKKVIENVTGLERVEKVLASFDVPYKLLLHGPVVSTRDVMKEIGSAPQAMVKTVVFRAEALKKFVVVAVLASKRVDKNLIAESIGISKSGIEFASEKEIASLGFPIGGIAPFGFEDSDNIIYFMDEDIRNLQSDVIFTGAGDNNKTLQIGVKDFVRITSDYRTLSN